MSSSLVNQEVPVNRALVGVLSIVCIALAGLLAVTDIEGPTPLWQGALQRVGIVLGAFWLALPTRTREAAWARVPLWNVVGVLLALILIGRSKVPLKFLLPGAIVFGLAILILRPRAKRRPKPRLFG